MVNQRTTETATFFRVTRLLDELTGGAELLGFEVTRQTTFHDDLQLESIDLVTFASILSEHYGQKVNLAEFLAEKELDEVVGLRVGDIVDYVESRVDVATSGGPAR